MTGNANSGTRLKIFLDTTIQLDRVLGAPQRRQEITRNLVGREVLTSHYVLMEYQRTVVRDLVELREIVLHDCPEDDAGYAYLSRLLRNLRQGPGWMTERKLVRRLATVAAVLEDLAIYETGERPESLSPRFELNKAGLLEHLAWRLRFVRLRFEELPPGPDLAEPVPIQVLADIECNLVDADLPLEHPWRYSCSRARATCRLPRLLEAFTSQASAASLEFSRCSAARSEPRLQKALAEVFASKPPEYEKMKGLKNCWPAGDLIIAMLCPDDAYLYSTDHSFGVLCQVFDKMRYVESVVATSEKAD